MVNTTSYGGVPLYGVKEFVCDTKADVVNLPTDCAAGSTVFVIEDSSTYMINSKKQWINIKK